MENGDNDNDNDKNNMDLEMAVMAAESDAVKSGSEHSSEWSEEELDFEAARGFENEANRSFSSSSSADVDVVDDDDEYGGHTLTPNVVTKNSSVAKNDFYSTNVRRQNCWFGVSMVTFAGAFIAAYFLMGLSFTPSNIGVFGDESSMKGGSGEVGLDADNAETQEVVDEEIVEIEEAGHWGDNGIGARTHSKTSKQTDKVKERMKDLLGRDDVGKHDWVENKDWWKKNSDNMDVSQMSKREKRQYDKMEKEVDKHLKRNEKKCRKHPELAMCKDKSALDLDSIRDKLANHYEYEATGVGKENFPQSNEAPDRNKGKEEKKEEKKHHKNKDKHHNINYDPYEEVEDEASGEGSGPDGDFDEEASNEEDTEDSLSRSGNEGVNEPIEAKEDEKQVNEVIEDDKENPKKHKNEDKPNNINYDPYEEAEGGIFGEESAPDSNLDEEASNQSNEEETDNSLFSSENEVGSDPVEAEKDEQQVSEVIKDDEENPEDVVQNVIVDKFTVLKQVGHDSSSFTQGLSYGPDGTIYETTGLRGKSKVRKINPDTFEVEKSVDTEGKYFGEGSTYFTDADGNGRLIEITWQEQTGFIYDSETLEKLKEFKYTTTPARGNEGWGITYDASKQQFIVSDGSQFLYFWDRDTLDEVRKVKVTRFDGNEQNQLNELEYMGGLVCCNIWFKDEIICVDPDTGKSVREYDMSSLWRKKKRGKADVLNGIALGKDHVLLTGKLWDRMYKIEFPDWPDLFANVSEDTADEEEGVKEVTDEDEGEGVKEVTDVDATDPVEAEETEEQADEVVVQKTIVNKFTVLKQVGHDASSFTQGLSYGPDGTIYETTGIYRQSKVRKINPDTFEVEKSVDIDGKYFGEGSTYFTDADGNGRLIEITWKQQTGIIYDSDTLEKLQEFQYTTTPARRNEGWGITYDASKQQFIVSDGSKFLYFWDRDTLDEIRKVKVTRFDGKEQDQLNELEYMDGLVCCNIWHKDDIICVDPDTGKSVREYDLSSLWPASQRGGGENVLNGIALGKGHVLITGKRWDRMYKINFPDWPSLFAK